MSPTIIDITSDPNSVIYLLLKDYFTYDFVFKTIVVIGIMWLIGKDIFKR